MNDMYKLLDTHIDEEFLIKMTADMVAIESHPEVPQQETAVAKYIKTVLDEHGVSCELKHVIDGRYNIIATVDSGLPGKTLMFNGHMDTVRADGMLDAFIPKIKDGKLYGRGASDMKSGVACAVGAMIALKELNLLKKGKAIFTGVLDEEEKSLGTIDVLESGLTADAAIICEPSERDICTYHRGLEWFQFHFIGKAVHGGTQKLGINAIAKAVKFINALEEFLIPKVTERGGTINYGVIHGGTQLSTVAGECDLYVDRRFLYTETYEGMTQEFQDILDALAEEDPDFRCEMRVMKESVMKEGYVHAPMQTDIDHPIVALAQECSEMVQGRKPELTMMRAWTDGGLLQYYGGIPTIIMGPGVMECCHALEEYVPIRDLKEAALTYALIAERFCNE